MQKFFTNEKAVDEIYKITRDAPELTKFREYIEKLWEIYSPYSDKDFLIESKIHFHQRLWEMYLTCSLIEQHIDVLKTNDNGPDIKLNIENKTVWCEATSVERGERNNMVDEVNFALKLSEIMSQSVPEEKMILRLTSSIKAKHKKYKKYVESSIINKEDPYIIALNRRELEFPDNPRCPLILKAVFGLGFESLDSTGCWSWTERKTILNSNGVSIPTMYFRDPNYSGISAILYETEQVIDLQDNLNMAENYILIHNPLASNPLPRGILKLKNELP